MVNAPIAHREVFLIVPYSIIISLDKCHRDPVMGKVFAQNPELFTKRHKDWEQLTLTVFLMYQRVLGDKSLWAPYIELMPEVTFFCDESKKDIMITMDPFLFAESLEYKEQLHDTWIDVLQTLKKYPKIFP